MEDPISTLARLSLAPQIIRSNAVRRTLLRLVLESAGNKED